MTTELERTKEALEIAHDALTRVSTHFANTAAEIAYTALDNIGSILNPPPEYEEVELEGWMAVDARGQALGLIFYEDDLPTVQNATRAVKLTGTYRREKKKPVEKSVSGEIEWERNGSSAIPIGPDANFGWNNLIGKRGILTFTWQEPED